MNSTNKKSSLMQSTSELDVVALELPAPFEMEAPYEVNICRALAIKVEQLSHSIFDTINDFF